MKSDKRLEILLGQYQECLSFIRWRGTQIWQLPSISMAINSFFGITYLGYANSLEAKIAVLLASLFFTIILTIQLQKHRFLQMARNVDFRWIQDELCKLTKESDGIRKIELRTEQIWRDRSNYPDLPRTWWTRQGAYNWFKRSMYATMFVIFSLLLFNVLVFLSSIILIDC